MKPSLQAIALPTDPAAYGDQPFQPLVLTEAGYVIAGGPRALYVISMQTPPRLELEIAAHDRIAGFTVNQGYLYVQDGTVLSRWSMIGQPRCAAAINVVRPSQRYTNAAANGALPEAPSQSANDAATNGPDWAALHKLPAALEAKREQLARARRRAEWAALLEEVMMVRRHWSSGDGSVAELSQLSDMLETLWKLLGLPATSVRYAEQARAAADAELAKAMAEAASIIISPPVVREHKIWSKRAAAVFVIGRDGTLHPLDMSLDHLGTRRGDRGAQPALAMTEFPEADSDVWACRLYYVDDAGGVQAIDGRALPPVELPSWPAKAPIAVSKLRLRIVDDLLWGGGALGANLFALPIDKPTEPSRVAQPLPPGDWRWLEVRAEASLALVSSETQSKLLSYDRGARAVDRWGARADTPPCFGTFIPGSTEPKPGGRPLLVLEVDRTAAKPSGGVSFRVMVANTVDAADAGSGAWYPPAPKVLFDGSFDAWASGDSLVPREVRTQPSVSKQDVYVVARTATIRDAVLRLLDPNKPGSWAQIRRDIMARPDAASALAAVAPPARIGQDALFCYPIGHSITSEQAATARRTIDELRELARSVRLRIVLTERWMWAGDKHWTVHGPAPVRGEWVMLRFGNGTTQHARTDGDGWVMLSPEKAGLTVTMDPTGHRGGSVNSCRLDRNANNQLDQESSWIQ